MSEPTKPPPAAREPGTGERTKPETAPAAAPAAKPPAGEKKAPAHAEHRDTLREIVETVVFVVVLVLLLQLFVAQAFVIPTGSMATTLFGHHKWVTCSECGYEFAVNASDEVEKNQPVLSYTCPNCRYYSGREGLPSPSSGDRVIVLKPIYHISPPQRWDVPVFKFPGDSNPETLAAVGSMLDSPGVPEDLKEWIRAHPDTPLNGPLEDWGEPRNYIKRLIGTGGETVAITGGDLYVTTKLEYPPDRYPRPRRPEDLWKWKYMYVTPFEDLDFLARHQFQILRKPPKIIQELKRIVWDNDHQPESLIGKVPPRWQADPEAPAGWGADDPAAPKVFTHAGPEEGWLRYQHLVPNWDNPAATRPELIRDFMGYNATRVGPENWVGDLLIECEAEVRSPDAVVTLELAEGVDRFRARFSAAEGTCTLFRIGPDEQPRQLAAREVSFNGPGTYRLQFANFDGRLTVWVDSAVVDFGADADYPPPEAAGFDAADQAEEGWVPKNDLGRPARIGAAGEVTVRHVKLWRDTFYTVDHPTARGETYYVQPGHYFCLGDNSAQSADSRRWGLVPDRLLIGRAVVVYYPFSRIGLIR